MDAKRAVHVSTFIIRILFYIFCLCGCVYQIHGVLRIYFNYQTTIEVKLRRPQFQDMPTISFCFNLSQTYEFFENKSAYHLKELPVDQLHALSRNFSELSQATDGNEGCWVAKPRHMLDYNNLVTENGSRLNVYTTCSKVVQPIVNYLGAYKCFSFFHKPAQCNCTC